VALEESSEFLAPFGVAHIRQLSCAQEKQRKPRGHGFLGRGIVCRVEVLHHFRVIGEHVIDRRIAEEIVHRLAVFRNDRVFGKSHAKYLFCVLPQRTGIRRAAQRR
jgi:hypothetical protein